MWYPNGPKQAQIYNDRIHRYLHALGDPRSGKSRAFFQKAWNELLEQPGVHGLITRDSGTSISMFTYPQFREIVQASCGEDFILDQRVKPYPFFRFANGSEVSFIPYDEIDVSKAGGSEYGFILIDEATRFTRKQWDYMDTRLSQQVGQAIRPDGTVFTNKMNHWWLATTANPAGRGWTWKVYTVEHPLSYAHGDKNYRAWRFYLEDNAHNLPPAYVDAMRDKPEHIRRKILGANEEPTEGLVFPMFSREIHVIKQRNFTPPVNWKIYGGMDQGYQTPTVFLWMAITEDGFIIFFREYRKSQTGIADNAKNILTIQKQLFDRGASWIESARIDPSTCMVDGKSGSSKTTYSMYMDSGMDKMNLIPARKQRVWDRVNRVRDLLMPDPLKQNHPITGEFREAGWPTIFFTEDCDGDEEVNGVKVDGGTISEMEEWEIREQSSERRNAPEEPESKNDHGPDCVAYVLQFYFNDVAPDHPQTIAIRTDSEQELLKKAIYEDLDKSLSKEKGRPSGTLQGGVY